MRSPCKHCGWVRLRQRAARAAAALWLPLSLGALAVLLQPVLDDFLLSVLLVMLALGSTRLSGLLRRIRRLRARPRVSAPPSRPQPPGPSPG